MLLDCAQSRDLKLRVEAVLCISVMFWVSP